MAKLFDKLMNRVIKGKLTIEDSDELSTILKDAVESAEKSKPIVFDATEQHHTQAQLKEAVSHKVLKLGENLFYRIAYSDDYVSYIYANVSDDGIGNGEIKSLTFAIDSDDSSVSEPDLYEYTFGELVDFRDTDLSAKTLSQSEANWEADYSEVVISAPVGITGEFTFFKFVKYNRTLHIVAIMKLTNTTENSISLGNSITFRVSDIPESISSKIYDVNGEPLSVSKPVAPISADMCFLNGGTSILYINKIITLSRRPSFANTIDFQSRDWSNLAGNTSEVIVFRTSLIV